MNAAHFTPLAALIQAAAGPPVYDTQAVTRACSQAATGQEIVVCGKRDKLKYRLPPLPPEDAHFDRVETTLGGGKLDVATERGAIGGIPTNRLMVNWKIKF